MTALSAFLFSADGNSEDPFGDVVSSADRRDSARVTAEEHDRALLIRLRGDDETALATLFDRYWEPLCAFATRTARSPELARDVVQDVFVRVWELRRTLEVRSSVRAYLYAAVRHRVWRQAEHDAVVRNTEALFTTLGTSPAMGQAPAHADDAAAQHELAVALDQAFATLPPRTRQVAHLKWGDGLGRIEIAQVLGVSPFTVDKQIAAAVRVLRAALDTFLFRSE